MERIPPQNIEAEQYLIASLLIDEDALPQIEEVRISDNDFYDNQLKLIYQGIMKVHNDNKPIDIITVTDALTEMGLLDKVGGRTFVSSLVDNHPITANVKYYADIVKNKSILRQLININTDIATKCYEESYEVKTLLDEAEQKVFAINESASSGKIQKIQDLLQNIVSDILKNKGNSGLSGIASGYPQLDEMTNGFHNSEMIIIAARPSVGKTAFAMNVAANAAIKNKKKIGVFSCEMSTTGIINRMLCSEARVNASKLQKGLVDKNDTEHIVFAAGQLFDTKIYFDDTPNIQLGELKTKARKMVHDLQVEMIIIDYLQLITLGDEAGKNAPRHEQVAFVSRNLKQLARQLNIPIIALAQLNRNVEEREGNSRPKLSDLKDSGSIEQDADVIMFLHRPSAKKIDSDDDGGSQRQPGNPEPRELIVGKNRNGPVGKIDLVFLNEYTRFESATKEDLN
ncbi:MAG: replicative DNA helicase [Spirochaetales bacterium]|nr:replicative DNA helicase [Spirochaetales bacterium]MBR6199045.1 replicative DNA helicase [Spirochaetales bacterium]